MENNNRYNNPEQFIRNIKLIYIYIYIYIYILNKKDLKVKGTMFLLKKLTILLEVLMVIKECNQLIRHKHMYME